MKKASGLARQLLGVAMVVLGLSTQPAQAAKPAEANNCSLKRITSIDLLGTEHGLAIMPVTINGKRAGVALRLDSVASVISPRIAEEWSLPRRMAPPFTLTFGDKTLVHMAEYEELTVGDMKYPMSATRENLPPHYLVL